MLLRRRDDANFPGLFCNRDELSIAFPTSTDLNLDCVRDSGHVWSHVVQQDRTVARETGIAQTRWQLQVLLVDQVAIAMVAADLFDQLLRHDEREGKFIGAAGLCNARHGVGRVRNGLGYSQEPMVGVDAGGGGMRSEAFDKDLRVT